MKCLVSLFPVIVSGDEFSYTILSFVSTQVSFMTVVSSYTNVLRKKVFRLFRSFLPLMKHEGTICWRIETVVSWCLPLHKELWESLELVFPKFFYKDQIFQLLCSLLNNTSTKKKTKQFPTTSGKGWKRIKSIRNGFQVKRDRQTDKLERTAISTERDQRKGKIISWIQ